MSVKHIVLIVNCVNGFLNVKALVGSFNKALVEAYCVIVKLQTSRRFVSGCSSGGVWCAAVSSFHYNITSKERVLLRLLLTAVRSTALLVDTNFAESPSSWETQWRPGHSVETSGDLLKTWTLARDQEETWRLGGDVSRTRAIFPLRRCCSCVVLAAGQQPRPAQPAQASPPPTINRKLSYS